jgi:hypothetical protein
VRLGVKRCEGENPMIYGGGLLTLILIIIILIILF